MQIFKLTLTIMGDCPDVVTYEIPQEMYDRIAEYVYDHQDDVSEMIN